MDTGKKPQSHGRKMGTGSVNVHKTEKVSTGGQPVGGGGRPTGGAQPQTGNKAIQRAAVGGGSLLLVLVSFLFMMFGGGLGTGDSGLPASPQSSGTQTVATQQPDTTVAASARPKRYVPVGNAQDTVTVMVYMCGTDLESRYGMATSDLQEMMAATLSSQVNVIVETGGCQMWKNNLVSAASNQIYRVQSGGLQLLRDDIGRKPMVEPATLTEFIRFCQENYPADRNILIFWDHGGGSVSGYGYDELFQSAGSMDLAEISAALKEADCVFDWIGFDACLMATLETALVCNDHADYLIASEETEPGTGWYYTGWLSLLSENPSVDTVTLAQKLIDDYIATSTRASASAQVTLSLVDLAEMQGTVPPAFNGFSTSTADMISGNNYAAVSNARAGARQFAKSSRINQIDLVDFADRVGTGEAQTLSQALRGCIKYNRSTIPNAYGLSIFFPYETTSSVKAATSTYNQVGIDAAYTKCISSFASLASSGQLVASASSAGLSSTGGVGLDSLLNAYLGGGSGGSASPLGSLLGAYTGNGGSAAAGASLDAGSVMQLLGAFTGGGRSLPTELDWLDTELVAANAEYIAANHIDPGDIFVTIRPDGMRVLTLTEDQWALIQAVELNVFVDDGAGFIDLGLDNVFEFDGNDLLLEFDGAWLTVNGHVAAFYMDSADEEVTTGHIPARLTQAMNADAAPQLVYLDVVFDSAHPDGSIIGARPMYEGETDTVAKGDITLVAGDVLEFLCDYYTYDNEFDSAYTLGEPLTVGQDGLEILYYDLGDTVCSVTYRLTDLYGNHYWTPAV